MDLTKEQLAFIAGLISNHLISIIDQRFEKLRTDLLKPREIPPIKLVERRIVAKQFNVTPDTISAWCRTGIIDKSGYTIINNRFKFYKPTKRRGVGAE